MRGLLSRSLSHSPATVSPAICVVLSPSPDTRRRRPTLVTGVTGRQHPLRSVVRFIAATFGVMVSSLGNPYPPTGDVPHSPVPESPPLEVPVLETSYNMDATPTRVTKEWVPFCEEELKPKDGLEFPNLDECEEFYKSYAHHVGFSIRKWSSKKGKEGVQKYNYYVCSKQGFRRVSTNVNPNRKVKLTREGCNALVGIPCCHILCVLKGKTLRELPTYYIVNRWTKMAASKPIFNVDGTPLEGRSQIEHENMLISRNWLEFLDCMQVAGRDPEKLIIVSKGIQNVLKEVKDFGGGTSESKISELESFIGSSAPEQIDILPPRQCNTKGSGKRLKSGKEKAMEQQAKMLRLCKACGQQAYHDSRNCPTKLS
ncbi:hypothetical protein Cgig2_033737 [Carnegiea gigantea]|uniref:FAR1 domain-containing protein n=1 Tax=Carnegiea gigantea TaxID=171969 RepID=A0A9Q1QAB8_9CARY|nr:hypothetical protein Cgig2_033737 [Carnegiea gigantea]